MPQKTQRSKSWARYAPARLQLDPRANAICDKLESFFAGPGAAYVKMYRAGEPVVVEMGHLSSELPAPGKSWGEVLRFEPDLFLAAFRTAVECASTVSGSCPDHLVVIHLSDRNAEDAPISSLRSSALDHFIMIEGTVIRCGCVRVIPSTMEFGCIKCRARVSQPFPDGRYRVVARCTGGCGGRSFVPDRKSVKLRDSQVLCLQEVLHKDLDTGRVPRSIDCIVFDDFVDCCIPGDLVRVYGVLRTREDDGRRNFDKLSTLSSFHTLERGATRKEKPLAAGRGVGGGTGSERIVEVTDMIIQRKMCVQAEPQQLYGMENPFIRSIVGNKDCFDLLCRSLCPQIIGHDDIKAGLLLGLVGGVSKNSNESDKLAVRGNVHVLLVGDPGVGKSQMLKACASIAPRGIFVASNMTTVSGITVTVVKDTATGDFALEAGALVLANQGVCCIDELDKSSPQEHEALLEAMEQQTISIAKAGITASCTACTTVMAAANPSGGSYNKCRTVSENLKISPAILSRFDLIFLMMDAHNKAKDEELSRYLTNKHSAIESVPVGGSRSAVPERQDVGHGDHHSLVPAALLRKFIAHARQYCKPVLSDMAIKELKAFYVELRGKYRDPEGAPITARQLESLSRLAEARARCELRQIVTAQDAKDVIRIVRRSAIGSALSVDLPASTTGMKSKPSIKGSIHSLLDYLTTQVLPQRESGLFTEEELYDEVRRFPKKIKATSNPSEIKRMIELWNEQGILLRIRGGLLKFVV